MVNCDGIRWRGNPDPYGESRTYIIRHEDDGLRLTVAIGGRVGSVKVAAEDIRDVVRELGRFA